MNIDFEPATQFAVDREARTISGLVIPYGAIGRTKGQRYTFMANSVRFDRPPVLLRDHTASSAIGRAIDMKESDAGWWMKFSVANTVAGNEALHLADQQILTGFSVGIQEYDNGGIRRGKGAYEVTGSTAHEVSLTAIPAFDDARVDAVHFNSEGINMPDTDEGQAPAPVALDFSGLAPAIAEAFAALPSQTPAEMPAGRAQVNEPLPYRFDGTMGEYDFSTDLHAWSMGNSEAGQRVNDFYAQAFAVATTDVNEINPTIQRPDMYVDNLERDYPIWNAIYKGSVPNGVTAFQFAKFNSSSGLVGEHTEGVEPTPGAFALEGQTVQPTTVSGKLVLNREVWDQGGNPALSQLIAREIQREYYKALEVYAVEKLDALSPTAIALSGTDVALQTSLINSLSGLGYTLGGNRFRDFFLAQNLFTAMAGATSDDGRTLFPVLAPQNATGTTNGFFTEVQVGGLTAKQAWALEVANGGDGSSYLFDRNDVWGWATPPQRIDMPNIAVATVSIGVWGYKAFANTRLSAIREVTYAG